MANALNAATAEPKPNGGAPAVDEPSGIDEIFDADGDMYDVGPDDGDDTDTGDIGDAPDSRAAPTGRDTQVEEPELPGIPNHEQRQQQPQYDADNPRGYNRVGTLFADAQGNIVTRDGRVMAAKGEPARHWFNMSKQVAQMPAMQRQVEALNAQIEGNRNLLASAQALADLPNRLGISKEDYNTGVQFVSAWNKDPLTVCRDLVARTMARGFNATDILGNDAGNSIEMSALRNLVNEVTAPQRERDEQIRVANEGKTTAERNYHAFIARYPVASVHQGPIATLMRQNGLTASEAYHELRYFALENGLDFAQPLGPQMEARQRAQQPQREQPTYRAPMVAGNGGGRRDHLTNETAMADPNSSWSEILDSVMRRSA